MTKTKSKSGKITVTDEQLQQLINKKVESALSKSRTKTKKLYSEFFIKETSETYNFNNLNSTIKYLEIHNSEFIKKLLKQQKVEKIKLNDFHKLLSEMLK